MEDKIKKRILEYGFFLGVTIVFSVALIPLIYFSQNTKEKVYSQAVQSLLIENAEKTGETVIVGKKLKLQSSFSSNATVFELSKPNSYAVVMRVETLYGPKPAAFIASLDDAEFLGWLLPQGKVKPALSNVENDINIIYWRKKLPLLMKKVGM